MKLEPLGTYWIALAVGAALSFLVMLVANVRIGGYLLGAVLLVTAVVRAVAPEEHAYGLRIRSRWLDVVMYALAALAVIAIFWTVKLA